MRCLQALGDMSRKKKFWIIGAGLAGAAVVALLITASILAKRWEPYIRAQAVDYLSQRFDSNVQIEAIRVTLPHVSAMRMLLTHGRGAIARVAAVNVLLRHHGRRDVAPMFAMKRVAFEVDLGTLFQVPKVVHLVSVEGMDATIPPKGEWPKSKAVTVVPPESKPKQPKVLIEQVTIENARLVILPKDTAKNPLRFDIHRLRLQSVGVNTAMKYDAALTNAVPPGEILSQGKFGPWNAAEPGDTALTGDYDFEKADLGVFSGIAGILRSTGSFEGTLDSINARGEATVPDFRLKRAGNKVPLKTNFQVLVDGTNGNTVLQPVVAILGSTKFQTSGAVIKREGARRRSILLDVKMPKGDLSDLLKLAMKGTPFMTGQLKMNMKIDLPPLNEDMRERLILDGKFEISDGRFMRPKFQDEIDTLSRRGQGQPNNKTIDEVVSGMKGNLRLDKEIVTFRNLSFDVPGAGVAMKGNYDLNGDVLDFHGTLKLKAHISQTMSGWKRWVLMPADPFFAKDGAGTLLHVQVVGNADAPKFGLDHGDKEPKPEEPAPDRGEANRKAR